MTERFPYPTEEELHEAQMEEMSLSMHFAGVGRIQSYDPEHQVADVVPMVRHPWPQPDGTYVFEDLPVLPAVPVAFPRMGKWFMAFSVEPGDAVQLVYDSAAPGAWRRQQDNGATGLDRIRELKNPATLQRHHLSNAIAIAGIDTFHKALRHAPPFQPPTHSTAGITLGSDIDNGTRQRIKGDGALFVEHGTHPVFRIEPEPPPPPLPASPTAPPSPDFVALAAKVDAVFVSLQNVFDSWTPVPNDGGAALKTALAVWVVESVAAVRVKAS